LPPASILPVLAAFTMASRQRVDTSFTTATFDLHLAEVDHVLPAGLIQPWCTLLFRQNLHFGDRQAGNANLPERLSRTSSFEFEGFDNRCGSVPHGWLPAGLINRAPSANRGDR
jgi:hypothetical protein